ncbi:hypothetical protein KPH14_003923 [Odynerus spinipes]|uniref:ETFB lysine methyltransferase n=1 Tax=Odynerus spinipes TaxID=1348599 RepID=A0AAD9VVM9_9HYME|nr:hypothetical protein KPH14_003923 [Odynerus spinipes]
MKKAVPIFYKAIKREISKDSLAKSFEIVRNSRNWGNLDRGIDNRAQIVEAILKHTEITNDHMTPDISLFLLTPSCPLYHDAFDTVRKEFNKIEERTFAEPFWSIYWPGGQGLVKFIFEEWESIFVRSKKDTNVLDLGAGCGAAAIATKLVGVQNVLANDIDKVACIAILMNAALNNVDVRVSWENLLHGPLEDFYDVIFVGDLLYDEELTEILLPWLINAAKKGTRILLGDPGRHGLTSDLKRHLKLLRRYELAENTQKENNGYHEVCVWQFVNDR